MEVITHYSNNPTLLDDLRDAREPVLDPVGEDEPELGGEHRANGRRWALAHRLASGDRQTVVDGYRAGATARELAERFSISESSYQRSRPSSMCGYLQRGLRAVLDRAAGDTYSWVVPHTFRRTVATRLDEAGATARQIADHLGHERPSMTQDVYIGRGVAFAGAAQILAQ